MDNKQEKDDSSNVTGTDNNGEGLNVDDTPIETVVVPSLETCQSTITETEVSSPSDIAQDDVTNPSRIDDDGPLTTPLTYAEDLLPADSSQPTQMGSDIDQENELTTEMQLSVKEGTIELPMPETAEDVQSIISETEDTPVQPGSPAQQKLIDDAANQIAQSAIHDAILCIEESPTRDPYASKDDEKLSSDGETKMHADHVEQSTESKVDRQEGLPLNLPANTKEEESDPHSDKPETPSPTIEQEKKCDQTNENLPPPPSVSEETVGDNNDTLESPEQSTDIIAETPVEQSNQTSENPPPSPPATEYVTNKDNTPFKDSEKSTDHEEDLPLPPPANVDIAMQSQVSMDLPSPPPLEETNEQQQQPADEMPAPPPPILTISPPEDFPSPPEDIASSEQLPSPPPVEEMGNSVTEDEFPLPPPEDPVHETIVEDANLPPPPDVEMSDESQETTQLISEKTVEAASAETGETNPGVVEQSQNGGKETSAQSVIDPHTQEQEHSKNGKSAESETEGSPEKQKNAEPAAGKDINNGDTPENEPLTSENPAATSRGQEAQNPISDKAKKSCCVVM
uniref:Fibrous sheath CABYR-binding protein n=1 Tax=Phallusia mammillata TaxID=59560 RepID=A0A6F9DCI2_9ASCI|nr:fibrous sheath CABYR-binding protein [Phallusia mammillata]